MQSLGAAEAPRRKAVAPAAAAGIVVKAAQHLANVPRCAHAEHTARMHAPH
jgi:hypothetical protein